MFAILNGPRAGSHLLRSLLDSHPDLTCHDEILGLRKHEHNFYKLGANEGCLVAYSNLIFNHEMASGNDIERLLEILRNVPVIHLIRDVGERARSQFFYAKTKQRLPLAFRKANLDSPIALDPEPAGFYDDGIVDVLKTRFVHEKNLCLTQFELLRIPWLEITYDWLCGNEEISELPVEKASVLCRYLGVAEQALQTTLYKTRKFDRMET